MVTALTIAGSDPGGGAGIQADLKTFAALGVYGTSAITALTAQNTLRVSGVHVVPPDFVVAQIDAVADDIPIAAAKTGMLATARIVSAVAEVLARRRFPWLVVDPVMIAKSGDRLLDEDALREMTTALIPLASVVTPNLMEAAALTGRAVRARSDARDAAKALVDLGARAAIVKGGHFEEPDVVDLLYDGRDLHEFSHPRQHTRHTHGTGCTFAAALTAHLALGHALPAAVALTVDYIAGAIAHGLEIGGGHGPLDHFWRQQGSPASGE
jgi:hydroxymethylpyrimidine/phosphomethylpyrimidine kinase